MIPGPESSCRSLGDLLELPDFACDYDNYICDAQYDVDSPDYSDFACDFDSGPGKPSPESGDILEMPDLVIWMVILMCVILLERMIVMHRVMLSFIH